MLWTCFRNSEGLCICNLFGFCVSSGTEGCRLRGRNWDFSLRMALVGTRRRLFQL